MLLPVSRILRRFALIKTTDFKFNLCYSVVKMPKQPQWATEKERILSLSIEEKRKLYKDDDYIILNQIDPWSSYFIRIEGIKDKKPTREDVNEYRKLKMDVEQNKELCEKVAIFKGDITKLEIDAIVNAANCRLKAGGGVDGAIHRVAGPLLQKECDTFGGCATGEAKITGGYHLPAKYVIHTVGPQDGSVPNLQSCYEKSLGYQNQYKIRSIAFPCISTGIYGFPNRLAAHTALKIARKFLENNKGIDRIIFCTFMPVDVDIYETLMQMYFPVEARNDDE